MGSRVWKRQPVRSMPPDFGGEAPVHRHPAMFPHMEEEEEEAPPGERRR